MYRNLLLSVCLILLPAVMVMAQESGPGKHQKPSDAKELTGMSIVGNDEAPKSLYIVPWKSSELGIETSLAMRLDDSDKPVDRDVFLRRLSYYRVSTEKVNITPISLAQQN